MKHLIKIILLPFFVILLIAVLFVSGCAKSNNIQVVGGDKDIHGCIGSAGYSWCESKQKCLRIWEEACTIEDVASGFCGNKNVSGISICEQYVRIESSLPGVGVAYYDLDRKMLKCPIVPPGSESAECKDIVNLTCENIRCE